MKSITVSKTFWFNVLTISAGIVSVFQGNEFIAQNPGLVSMLGITAGIINVFLRAITTEPVKF